MSLGSKLSPKLRKARFNKPGGTLVRSIIELAPGADIDALSRALTAMGARIQTHSEQARVMTVDIPVDRLRELDTLNGIVYVEADERYRS